MSSFLQIIAVIVGGGAAGGLANFLLNCREEDRPKQPYELPALIIVGVIVAFTVPLFLSLAQSGLIDAILHPRPRNGEVPNPSSELLILTGFCIAAAFVSRTFMDSIAKRLVDAVGEAKAIAKDAHSKAEQVEETVGLVEESIDRATGVSETPLTAPPNTADANAAAAQIHLTDTQKTVLQAVSRLTLRTATGIAKDAGIPRNQVGEILDELIRMGLVEKTTSPSTGNLRHRVTPLGISVINHALKAS